MTEILINVYNFFGAILPFCFAIAIIGFILLLVSKSIDNFGSKTEKIKLFGIAFFVQIFMIGIFMIGLQSSIKKNIKNEILLILKDSNTTVTQSDYTFGNFSSTELKTELQKVKNIEPHHSHPEKEMKLNIQSKNKKFHIIISQDSNNNREFWIFTDLYHIDSELEIGRINSTLFE